MEISINNMIYENIIVIFCKVDYYATYVNYNRIGIVNNRYDVKIVPKNTSPSNLF